MMIPERFDRFAAVYVEAVQEAVKRLGAWRASGETIESMTLANTVALLEVIQRKDCEAAEHYVINSAGGAMRAACLALGLDPGKSPARTLQDWLEGRV